MRNLYLVTDDNQDVFHVVADDMGQVETYFQNHKEFIAETVQLVDDELIILDLVPITNAVDDKV